MTKPILMGLILVTTAVFSLAYAFSQHGLIAVFALVSGLFWLAQEYSPHQSAAAPFFLVFMGLSVVGSLNHLPALAMLFGLSTNLAAWDLSRFWNRITSGGKQAMDPMLEQSHLQRLSITLGTGLLAALPPLLVRISISFAAFAGLMLLVVVLLRASALHLRPEPKSGGE